MYKQALLCFPNQENLIFYSHTKIYSDTFNISHIKSQFIRYSF